jgi:hypothetical protein
MKQTDYIKGWKGIKVRENSSEVPFPEQSPIW